MILKLPVVGAFALLHLVFAGLDSFLITEVAGSPSIILAQETMGGFSLIMPMGIDGIWRSLSAIEPLAGRPGMVSVIHSPADANFL